MSATRESLRDYVVRQFPRAQRRDGWPSTQCNRAFFGAYRKGREAAKQSHKPRCPYPDHRCGRFDSFITFSRAFASYWWEGVYDEAHARPDRHHPPAKKPR